MRAIRAIVFVLGATATLCSAAEGPADEAALLLTTEDAQFLKSAASASLAEVEAGRLAATRAIDPAVRDYGQQMVKDHTRTHEKLKRLAQEKGVALASSPRGADQSLMARLRGTSEHEFDRAYLALVAREHGEAVALFERASYVSPDHDIREFATRALPALQSQRDLAEGLKGALARRD